MLRALTRVAVVQLAFHPAAMAERRSPLADPLYEMGQPDSLLPENGDVPVTLRPQLDALRRRVREAYGAQLLERVRAILASLTSLGVRVAVFPEHSLPWEILGGVADAAGDILVVAGSHTVERAGLLSGIYERLGAARSPEMLPEIGREVCPVLHRGRLVSLQHALGKVKHTASSEGSLPVVVYKEMPWTPTSTPEGVPGPMGVLPYFDFIHRDLAGFKEALDEGLRACRFLAVPSLLQGHEAAGGKAWEESRRFGKPVLHAAWAKSGGTSIFVDEARGSELRFFPDYAGHLERGDEGAIIADVDLFHERSRQYNQHNQNTIAAARRAIVPVAEATLVYRAHPVSDAYARWLEETAPLLALLAEEPANAVLALASSVESARDILLNAGALSGSKARDRRLRRMLDELNNLTDVEEFRQFTREIILPPTVLPPNALRAAIARGAADAVFAWLMRAEARAAGFGEVEARLRGQSEKLVSEGGSWTRASTEAFSAVSDAVRGALDPIPAPPPSEAGAFNVPEQRQMRVVLPKGVDPASLGMAQSRGFTLDFRAKPDDFNADIRRALDEPPSKEPSRKDAPRARSGGKAKSSSVMAGFHFSEAHLWVAHELYLLAIAEGAERVSVVGVMPEQHAAQDGEVLAAEALLVISSAPDGDGWIAREAGRTPWLSSKWLAVRASLADAGLASVVLEEPSPSEYPKRLLALMPRFDGARATIEQILALRLREVAGHFIEPDVRVGASMVREPMKSALDTWLASDEQTALVLGEFGSGKSTALAEWAHQKWALDSGPRPILVSLAAVSRALSAEALLLEAARAPDTRENRAALRLLVSRRLILPCFDGFDEMATRLDAADLAGRLSSLLEVARGGGKVIVTSRDNYFPAEDQLRTTAEGALMQALGGSTGSRRLILQPLTEAQVRSLVQMVRGEAAATEEALAKIALIYDLRDLVSRPLLLGMVLATLDQMEPGSKVGTADLYEAYLTRWLAQTRSGDPECFTDDQKIEFAEALAEQLWRSGRATCSWAELQESVRARLAHYLPHDAPPAAAFLEIQGGAFFVREGDDRFRFAHKSFLEYFVGRGLVSTAADRPKEALTTKPITMEVASFVGEILRRHGSPKDSPAVRRVSAWLADERSWEWPEEGAPSGAKAEAQTPTTVPAANAARLLLELGRWAKDAGGWIPEGADLRGVKMAGEDLRGASLTRARLWKALLSGADLRGADLTSARLDGARLDGAKLDDAILRDASAECADFVQAEAHGADLTGADLSKAILRQSMWTSCQFDDVKAAGADVTGWSAPGDQGALGEQFACAVSPTSHTATLAPGRSQRIFAVAWSPDGVRLAIAGKTGVIRIWDPQTGHDVAHLYGHSRSVNSIAWHPDGTRLATASDDGTLRLWSAATGEEIAKITPGGMLLGVAFRPDGARIAAAGRGTIRVYDAALKTEIAAHELGGDGITAAAWSPDGSRLAFGGEDGLIRFVDAETGSEIAQQKHDHEISAIRWSPDGARLAIMTLWGAVTVRDVSGAEIGRLDLKSKSTFALDFHPTGEWLACGSLRAAHIWSLKMGQELAPIELSEVTSVAWSRDGDKLAVGTSNSGTRIWDFEARKEIRRAAEPSGSFEAVAFSSDGSAFATAGSDGSARLWNAKTGLEMAQVDHEKAARIVALHPDHGLFAAAAANSVKVMSIADGREVQTLEFVGRGVAALAWHPSDPCLVMTGAAGTILFDVSRRTLRNLTEGGGVVAFSPSGDRIAIGVAGWRGPITILTTDTDEVVRLTTAMGSVSALAWNPSGDLLAWAGESGIEVRSVASGEAIASIEGLRRAVTAIAWSPDGRSIAGAAGDDKIRLWDAKSGALIRELTHPEDLGLGVVAFRRDGKRVAAGGNAGLYIWDVDTGRLLCTFEALHKNTLARTPGGFCAFGGGDPDRYRLALRRPEPGSRTKLYLPLAGLREALHRPDKVADALNGDLRGDDLASELSRLGLDNGSPWNGRELRVTSEPLKKKGGDHSEFAPQSRGIAPRRSPGSGEIMKPAPPFGDRATAYRDEATRGADIEAPPPSVRVPPPTSGRAPTSAPAPLPFTTLAGAAAPKAAEKDRSKRSLPPPKFAQQSQIPLQNPFRPGPALTDAETLPGRELVINELLALIDSRSAAVLRGPRRAGKTSILHSIEKRLAAHRRPVLRLTLEATHIITPDDLARVIDPSLKTDSTPSDTLRARLRESRKTTLLLDEVANLKGADPSVFAWLRAVGQEDAGLVFAGSFWDWVLVVERASSAPGSSFGNDVTPVSLGPIPRIDAVQFLVESAPPDVPIEEERTARWIIELCGTWPFYLQVMGHAVVQAARAGNRAALVERPGVSELYEQKLLVDRDAVFRGRWAELPDRAKKLVRPGAPAFSPAQGARVPAYNDLTRDDRKVLRDTGLCTPLGAWLDDPPFFDWIRRSADDNEGGS